MTKNLQKWLANLDGLAFSGLMLIFTGLLFFSGVAGLWVAGFFEQSSNESLIDPGGNDTRSFTNIAEASIEQSGIEELTYHRPTELYITLPGGETEQPILISGKAVSLTQMLNPAFKPTEEAFLLEGALLAPIVRLPSLSIIDYSNLFSVNSQIRIVDKNGISRRFSLNEITDLETDASNRQQLFDYSATELTLVWPNIDQETFKVAYGKFQLDVEDYPTEIQADVGEQVKIGDVLIKVETGHVDFDSEKVAEGVHMYEVQASFATSLEQADLGNLSVWLEDDNGRKYSPINSDTNEKYTQIEGTVSNKSLENKIFHYQVPMDLDTVELYQKFALLKTPVGLAVWLPYSVEKAAAVSVRIDDLALLGDTSKLKVEGAFINSGEISYEVLRSEIKLVQLSDEVALQPLIEDPDFSWVVDAGGKESFQFEFDQPLEKEGVLCIAGHQYAFKLDSEPENINSIDCD